jgi:FkbM family methyltransferase
MPGPEQQVLDWLLYDIFVVREYENASVRVAPGDVVMDCGAHVGTFTRFAAGCGASRVVCVEMDSRNASCLRKNVARMAFPAEVVETALWSKDSTLQFLPQTASDCHQVTEGQSADAPRKQATTVDHVVNELALSRLDFLKMDMEGAEPEALQGALTTLRTHAPKLALALYHHPDEETRVREILARAGLQYSFSYRRLVRDYPHILFGVPAGSGQRERS